jgi:hypothetical protein
MMTRVPGPDRLSSGRGAGLAAILALVLGTVATPSGPAMAGRAEARAVPEIAKCRDARPAPGARCGPAAGLQLDAFRGQPEAAAIRGFGPPERMRWLPGGARVLVWDRSAIAATDGGRVIRREECQLLMAVTGRGIVSDAVLSSDAESCARRFAARRQ